MSESGTVPAPSDSPAPGDDAPARFGGSARALAQRRLLGLVLALTALACLALLWRLSNGPEPPSLGARVLLAALPALALAAAARMGFSRGLAGREVLLHEHALELRRGGFRRLVVFENIRHIRTEQSPSGRLWSLRLDLEDDSVTLRDVEGLARVFAEAAQRRPQGTLIEAHETRVDWGEPLPWALLVLGLGMAALLCGWLL